MKVAVVGAGIAGLSAARALSALEHDVVLLEKSRGPGGRCATRRADGFVWDTGATSIVPGASPLAGFLATEAGAAGLHRIEKPVWVHRSLRVAPGDPRRKAERFTYVEGINGLAKRLAQGLDVRTEAEVEAIDRLGDGYTLRLAQGGTVDADAVILTAPIPQTCLLLWGLGEDRPLAHARYRTVVSVGLGYREAPPELPYFALIDPDQRHPLLWLSVESAKSPGRAPEGGSAFIAQFSPRHSLAHYGQSDEAWVTSAAGYIRQLYGLEAPAVSTVMRWKYSQPENISDFDEANPSGSRLLVASDGLLGGRLEEAYSVGIRAAARLDARVGASGVVGAA